jgi:phosphatidylserine/phosphatidylglycerophosphate/cardiolipin synthase-like enzyme
LSTSAAGRLADEDDRPWTEFTVEVHDAQALFDSKLGSAKPNGDGEFSVTYQGHNSALFGQRRLEFRVYDKVRRVLHREEVADTDDAQLVLNPTTIKRADAQGLLVTLGTGTSRFVSQGNAVTLLMDKDAFEYATNLFEHATQSVFVSQLSFDVPNIFDPDPLKERPALMFQFQSEPVVATPPVPLRRPGDKRPERILLDKAKAGVEVRILIHQYEFPLLAKLIVGAIAFAVGNFAALLGTLDLIREKLSDIHHLKRWLDPANAAQPTAKPIQARAFPQSPLGAGVLHSKLVVVDGQHALSIGSPFGQSYVDSHAHDIDAPRRGRATGLPKHDAGFGVDGPGVADFHETTRLIWNEDVTTDLLDPIQPPVAQTQVGDADAISSLQIVRTLTAGRFEKQGPKDGEKGILEAYQRAIGSAREFVYIETQYFTNDAIGESLVEAMKANHDLQVIVLCNIEPDVPTYPFKQRRLITRIRKAIGPEVAGQRPRFGVFTRWTHEVGTPRPRILPIYVHAKDCVVDDTWATIGSANLDGLSLDSSLLSDVLHKLFGAQEQRAIEVNGVFLNGVDGQPQTDLPALLRRKLFAEHLNYPSEDANDLLSAPSDGWLGLWQRRANEKRQRLVNSPAVTEEDLARVLPWPADDTTYKTPRKHLSALGVLTHKIVPLKSTRPFLFESGEFEEGKQPEMDYD